MYSTTNWRVSLAASALICLGAPLPAAAADLGGYEAAGTSYYDPAERRPLDNSYRNGYGPTNWTGLYLGGHAGWGDGQDELTGAIDRTVDTSGFLGGAHAGYNYQSGAFVAGLEIDGDWLNADGSENLSANRSIEMSTDWMSSLRLRLGFATGNWLLYGTAGVAITELDMTLVQPGADLSLSGTMTGYAAGIGAEVALTRSVSARIEALHYGFGPETFNTPRGAIDAEVDFTTIRGGLSIKLN